MRIAIDTNVFIDVARGRADLARVLEEASQIFMPLPVLAELHAGFRSTRDAAAGERLLIRLVHDFDCTILCPDEATAVLYADLAVDLRRAGTPIATNDIWIAAISLQHECSLLTGDADFDFVVCLPKVKFGFNH